VLLKRAQWNNSQTVFINMIFNFRTGPRLQLHGLNSLFPVIHRPWPPLQFHSVCFTKYCLYKTDISIGKMAKRSPDRIFLVGAEYW